MSGETRLVARFTPEAWVNGQAIEVDPEGPQEWDCTAFAGGRGEYLARCAGLHGESLDDRRGVTDNDDVFVSDPSAPAWVQAWRGPFTIRVRRERPDA